MSNEKLLKLAQRYKTILAQTAPYTKCPTELQKALNKLYPTFKLSEDGNLGPLTASALKAYCGDNSDTRDILDPKLWQDVQAKASGKVNMDADLNDPYSGTAGMWDSGTSKELLNYPRGR